MQSTVQKKIIDLQRKIRESTQVNYSFKYNEYIFINNFFFLQQAAELEQQLEEYKGEQQKNVTQISELGTERDQLTNQNAELDEHIVDLSLQKNMVNHHRFFLIKFIFYLRCSLL